MKNYFFDMSDFAKKFPFEKSPCGSFDSVETTCFAFFFEKQDVELKKFLGVGFWVDKNTMC